MQIYMGKRGSGKTTRLIKYCYENDCVLVSCINAKVVESSSRELGMPIKTISHRQFIDSMKMSGRGKEKYVIDEVGMLLRLVMANKRGSIEAIAVDTEEEDVYMLTRGSEGGLRIGGMELHIVDDNWWNKRT